MLRQSNYDVPCPHFDIIFTVFNIDLCLYSGRTSKQRHKKISCEKIFLKWEVVSRRRAEEKKSTEDTFCVHILAVIVITQYYIWNKAMREVTFCGGVISVLSLVVATAFSSWAQVFFHNFVHNHQDSFRYNVFFSNHQDSNSMSTVKKTVAGLQRIWALEIIRKIVSQSLLREPLDVDFAAAISKLRAGSTKSQRIHNLTIQ